MINDDFLKEAFNRKYPTGKVLAVAEITNNALQNWFQRKLVIGHGGDQTDMKEPFTGRRLFTFYDVMVFAIVKKLTGFGLDLPNAFKAANQFSHLASDIDGCRRAPAFPFAGGNDDSLFDVETFLAVNGKRSTAFPHQRGQETFELLRSYFPDGYILMPVNPVFDVVSARLGFHPNELIEWMYKGHKLRDTGWLV